MKNHGNNTKIQHLYTSREKKTMNGNKWKMLCKIAKKWMVRCAKYKNVE